MCVALGGCGDDDDAAADGSVDGSVADGGADASTAVSRGRYLVNNVGLCTFCHTPLNPDGSRDNTKLLAGVDCLFDIIPPGTNAPPNHADLGCVASRNLTNHSTGLMNATDAQIKNALKNGMRTDGKHMIAVMPYWIWNNMTDSDLDAIIAYLRTIPGVDHTVTASQPPLADPPAAAVPIDVSTIPMPSAGYPNQAAAMRGRYLSSMAGLCIDCHTPDTNPMAVPPPPRPIDMAKPFAGGRMFPAMELGLPVPPYPAIVTTRNLTPHMTGLMNHTVDDVKKIVKDGIDKMNRGVCAATHGGVASPYAGLTAGDLDDIAHYIVSLPPIDNDTGMDCSGPVP